MPSDSEILHMYLLNAGRYVQHLRSCDIDMADTCTCGLVDMKRRINYYLNNRV